MQIQSFNKKSAPQVLTQLEHNSSEFRLLQASMAKLNDIVVITEVEPRGNPTHKIVYVNEAFEKHTGYSKHDVIGRSPSLLQGQGSQHAELNRIRLALERSQPVHAELINYKKDGTLFWIELDIVPLPNAEGIATHWVSAARDITQRKIEEEEIEYLAFYDPLTQLPNRQMLMERLKRALSQTDTWAENEPSVINGALMFIDLDNFKILNDTLGHATGDILLCKVATRLGACVRLSDTVARLGGDEFVVMLESLPDDVLAATEYSRDVAQRILHALSQTSTLQVFSTKAHAASV